MSKFQIVLNNPTINGIITVKDKDLSTPPTTPTIGDKYIVGPSPTGLWTGKANYITDWDGNQWNFLIPDGASALVEDEFMIYGYKSSTSQWEGLGGPPAGSANGQIQFKVGATFGASVNLHWDNTNERLGIGTTSPSTRIDFGTASANFGQIVNFYTNGNIRMGIGMDSSATGMRLYIPSSVDVNNYIGFGTIDASNGSTWAEKVRVTADGKVGIGTTAPGGKLDVAGPTFLGEIASGNNGRTYVDNNGGARFVQYDNSGAIATFFHSNGNNYINGGNVGIGTTSPQSKLHITGSNPALAIQPSATGQTVSLLFTAPSDNSTYSGLMSDNAAGDFKVGGLGSVGFNLRFLTSSGAERMTIVNTGNVGIGTTTPAVKLDVDGPICVKSYTVATVPSAAAKAGQQIYVSNEVGGAVIAFSDGTNWLRCTDRAIIS